MVASADIESSISMRLISKEQVRVGTIRAANTKLPSALQTLRGETKRKQALLGFPISTTQIWDFRNAARHFDELAASSRNRMVCLLGPKPRARSEGREPVHSILHTKKKLKSQKRPCKPHAAPTGGGGWDGMDAWTTSSGPNPPNKNVIPSATPPQKKKKQPPRLPKHPPNVFIRGFVSRVWFGRGRGTLPSRAESDTSEEATGSLTFGAVNTGAYSKRQKVTTWVCMCASPSVLCSFLSFFWGGILICYIPTGPTYVRQLALL